MTPSAVTRKGVRTGSADKEGREAWSTWPASQHAPQQKQERSCLMLGLYSLLILASLRDSEILSCVSHNGGGAYSKQLLDLTRFLAMYCWY